jgi:hypothetical protein
VRGCIGERDVREKKWIGEGLERERIGTRGREEMDKRGSSGLTFNILGTTCFF